MFPRKCRFSAALIVWAILGGLAVSLLPGCGGRNGPQRASVAGKVTVDGRPLEEASIAFVPSDATAGPSSGGRIADGAYAIEHRLGPAVGTYRVEILALRKTGKKVEVGPPAAPGTMIEKKEQYLPPKYNTQTTLTAEIKPGNNQIDFDLRTRP